MSGGSRSSEAIRQIVDRSDLEVLTERVLDSFWARPEYQRFRPSRDDVRAWVRWNIDLVVRWLADGDPPTEAELERYRERARSRAAEGMPAHIVPANFHAGARAAWTALLEAAHEHERPALLEGADLLFEFVERVSQLFSDTYESAEPVDAVSADERLARRLLRRVVEGEELAAEDRQFAEGLGFRPRAEHRPFVLAAPSLSIQHHAAVAGRLRSTGVLAASEGRHVLGLANGPLPTRAADIGSGGVAAEGELTARAQLPDAFEELRGLVEIAIGRGRTGPIQLEDHLAELLLRRSPRLGAQLRARVYGRLEAGDPELTRTLDRLIEHDFDRGATAAALPVHRNTLNNRLKRIRAITGLDVDRTDGRSLAWLAWLDRADGG